jgi:ADP-ribosyl-[dinitrogen reductase] hydrolase
MPDGIMEDVHGTDRASQRISSRVAARDGLGTTLEFKPISDTVGGGPFRLESGQWTDDTSMTYQQQTIKT